MATFSGVQVVDMRVRGDLLAAAALDGSFLLLNLKNAQQNTLKLPRTPINLTFAGEEVAVLMDEMVGFVNIMTLEVVCFKVPSGSCRLEAGNSCFFLAVGSNLYRTNRDFTEKEAFPSSHSASITDIKLSPSGEYLASSDTQRLIFIWSPTTLTVLQDQMVYHSGKVVQVCWTPDSRYLVSGAIDKSVIVWKVLHSWRQVIGDCHRLGVTAVTVGEQREDCVQVVSTGEDLTVKVWTVRLTKYLD